MQDKTQYTKVQDDKEVYAYMWHNTMKDAHGNKTEVKFGSAIELGQAAEEEGIDFSEINRRVDAGEITCFVNGSLTVWKRRTQGHTGSRRKLA